MQGDTLYRIKASALQDNSLDAEQLTSHLEPWAEKPICDSISIDSKGNVYAL